MKQATYVSVDVETVGPCPGIHSMISLGAHALRPDGTFSTFSANILPLEGATTDPETMKWWQTQPEALLAVSVNQRPALEVMREFVAWVDKLPYTPVFVGWPIAFDWMFVAYYCHRFVRRNPFGYEGIDVKSYVAGMLNTPYLQTTKHDMPDEWFPENTQQHVAVADAIEQGVVFKNILEHNAMLTRHSQDIEARYRELSQSMDEVLKKLHGVTVDGDCQHVDTYSSSPSGVVVCRDCNNEL